MKINAKIGGVNWIANTQPAPWMNKPYIVFGECRCRCISRHCYVQGISCCVGSADSLSSLILEGPVPFPKQHMLLLPGAFRSPKIPLLFSQRCTVSMEVRSTRPLHGRRGRHAPAGVWRHLPQRGGGRGQHGPLADALRGRRIHAGPARGDHQGVALHSSINHWYWLHVSQGCSVWRHD